MSAEEWPEFERAAKLCREAYGAALSNSECVSIFANAFLQQTEIELEGTDKALEDALEEAVDQAEKPN